jgi:hypothetical protein
MRRVIGLLAVWFAGAVVGQVAIDVAGRHGWVWGTTVAVVLALAYALAYVTVVTLAEARRKRQAGPDRG